jgi:pilus assembly protein CpaB
MIRSLRAGDFITTEDLFDPAKGGLMGYIIPENFRAIGIRVNIADIAGGFASLPHSRVDIISTVRRGTDKDSYSQILLENVLVLAADANMDPSGKALPATVVTVAVSPEDALKLSLAKEHGPLSLMLRNYSDKAASEIDRVTFEQLINKSVVKNGEIVDTNPGIIIPPENPNPPPVTPKIEKKPEPEVVTQKGKLHRVTIIRGDQVAYQDFYLDEEGNVIPPELMQARPNHEPPVPMPTPKPKDGN